MVRKLRRSHVDQLSLRLLVAVSGVTAGVVACAGRSDSSNSNGGTSGSSGTNGGSSASGGTTGGTGQGGSTPQGGSGGKGGKGGGSGQGGSGPGGAGGTAGTGNQSGTSFGGQGASAGMPNGGAGNVKPHGCVAVDDHPTTVAACDGGFAHRPPNAVCSLSPHPEPEAGGASGEGGAAGQGSPPLGPPEDQSCTTDADCTAGEHGYCIRTNSDQIIRISCVYGCEDDSACGDDQLCSCEDGYMSEVSRKPLAFGVCRQTNCRDDNECGPGLLCTSPLWAACGTPRPSDYKCQTTDDECGGPADCPLSKGECMYREGHYACEPPPACGRPFLVEGALRQSSAETCPAWLDETLAAEPLPALTPYLRASVAEHWVKAGLMEHASIAAFARFALQLMALGAPADLVLGATQAMADETRHAKTCFGLASRYAERELGPGPLDVKGALGAVELMDVVDLVIEEGCIGETGAALEAQWAADAAAEPVVALALRQIAEDEARHAELAWRFVAWAATRDARVTGRVAAHVEAALARLTATTEHADATTSRELARHGVLDERARREARLAALSEVLPGVVARLAA